MASGTRSTPTPVQTPVVVTTTKKVKKGKIPKKGKQKQPRRDNTIYRVR